MQHPNIPDNKDLTYLGYATFRGKDTLFGIKRKDRRQHMYILGKSGTGKSVLMFNMVIQNIQNGEGVCLVDPHGENVEAVLSAIPEHRMKDVVYFNPADTDFNIGFNVLELVDPKYKHLVASGLMGIFTKIWANAWSSRMEYILNNTILALLDTPGTTLLGIPRMLVDKDYRQKIISNLKDPVVKAFWIHEYEAWQEKFRNEAIAPIQNKVGQFLSTSVIRNIVGQKESTINIFDIMNQGKILLVNVSKGRIGEDNSKLLGGMIVTKIQLAAMERVRIREEERKDFYLYVDEFQNFVTDSFASILSEARKYRLSLTVAHQYIAQLVTKEGTAMRDSIFGNVGTMILFRAGADDAKFLEKELAPSFIPEDLINLPNYRIYLKLMIDGVTSRPFSAKTIPPLVKGGDKKIEEKVIQISRENYCRPKEDVEKEINDWSGSVSEDTNNMQEGGYKIICAICSKESKVPFKPELGRAVYCKDCVAKIKAGELKPIKLPKLKIDISEQDFYQSLALLGIEYKLNKKNEEQKEANEGIEKIEEIKSVSTETILNVANKKKKRKNGVGLKNLLNQVLKGGTEELEKKGIFEEIKEEKTEEASLSILNKTDEKEKIQIKDKSASKERVSELKNIILEKENILNNIKSLNKEEDAKNIYLKDLENQSNLEIEIKDEINNEKTVETKTQNTIFPDFGLKQDITESNKEEKTEDVTEEHAQKNQKWNWSRFKNNQKEKDKNYTNNQSNQIKEVPENVLRKILEE